MFGILFRLEKFHWRLVVIVLVMTGSVMMMTQKPAKVIEDEVDDDHNPIGIVLVLAASFVLGLRWSFTQLLLRRNDYTRHPVLTIFYISPSMIVLLFIAGLFIEGWGNFMSLPIWELQGTGGTLLLMVVPGFLAFLMTLCEFKLLSVAQVLTLSVAGIFKELLTIMLGLFIFGDTLSVVNCIGLTITFADILWYNYFRYNERDPETVYSATPLQDDLSDGGAIELKQH